jgi:hypothetical protein
MVVGWDGAGPGKVGRAGIREGNQAYGLVVRFGCCVRLGSLDFSFPFLFLFLVFISFSFKPFSENWRRDNLKVEKEFETERIQALYSNYHSLRN